MGYDVAYHAINRNVILNELIPYCLGKISNIEDLVNSIARIKRSRHIANEYAKILLNHHKCPPPRNLIGKIFSKNLLCKNKESFNSDLYIWGRPFLVLEEEQQNVFDVIDRYMLARSDKELAEVIQSQFAKNYAGLYKKIDHNSLFSAAPSAESVCDEKEKLLNELKKLFQAAAGNFDYTDIEGNKCNPAEILENPFYIIEFLSSGYPAWMDRGQVTPSFLLGAIGLDVPEYVYSTAALLGNHIDLLKGREGSVFPENFSLGIVVFYENLEEFMVLIDENKSSIISFLTDNEKYPKECAELVFKKIEESIKYCIHSKSNFVESTDIFSGFLGVVS